jgi:Ppx/GppA phosphatase family
MRLLVKAIFPMVLVLAASSNAQTKHTRSVGSGSGSKKTAIAAQTEYYGAIDLGSKGTKATLYSLKAESNQQHAKVIFNKTINTKLVSSMKDGRFTEDGIRDATDAVKQLIDAMQAKAIEDEIKVDLYYVVGSSGVAIGKNREDLVASVKAATEIDMDFIDAAKEGYYGLVSVVPKDLRGKSMYIDVGSGNTKLGCLVGESDLKNFKSLEIRYGSVSGTNEGAKRNPKDIGAGINTVMDDVGAAYEKESRDVPCLRNRQHIYWTGGAAWATATFMHPGSAIDSEVTITKRDLDVFLARLRDRTWNQKKLVLSFPKDMPLEEQKKIRASALKDRDDVQNVFVGENLLSGVSIMKTVLDISNPSATVQFVRDGNFIYGYALKKYKEDSEAR